MNISLIYGKGKTLASMHNFRILPLNSKYIGEDTAFLQHFEKLEKY
jgi:hypothetical protein